MTQVLELLHKLNEKVDNASTRLMILEKKVRKLQKDVKSLRMDKGKMEEEDEDEGENEEEKGEKEVDKEESKGEENDSAELEEEDSYTIESNGPSLTWLQITGYKYMLRHREMMKFSNTMETPLVLTHSPPISPLPALSPHATPPHTSPPPATQQPRSPN
ncbi:DNA double-strand break repair Rad50 ATPase [Actinidia chinensis var. chinensis]|uniref:DNA double-strand break repair Rad50 ATPase n=1 Tax=Actinidia chinensis var. chinensis TaxID=1590841 RepID=A0A2R6QI39_ACTCC|nr:DNA double-strand break repair Rad50 ATPase [Actinidia chinensis var. chinensis]